MTDKPNTYRIMEPTNVLSADTSETFLRAVNEAAARGTGRGGYYNRFQTVLSNVDWFNMSPMNTNHEQVGMTFITRPRLNLSQSSLHADETLGMLKTELFNSFPFAIRCYLDHDFATYQYNKGVTCPFYNHNSPFLLPLTNQLTRISGFPQYELFTTTTPDGFFGENQTTAKGNDFGNSSHTITVGLQEMDGGFISSMIFYWIHWTSLMRRGTVLRYMDDILEKRLSYTCSIYRLVLDRSRSRVTKWAKLTGCFPTMISMGDFFDIPDRSQFITTTQEMQVQFAVNHVEYMKPSILEDFNLLAQSFWPDIQSKNSNMLPLLPEFNYIGNPYIAAYDGSNRLLRIADPSQIGDPLSTLSQLTLQEVERALPLVEQMYTPQQFRSGLVTASQADQVLYA